MPPPQAFVRLSFDPGQHPAPSQLGAVLTDVEGLYWLAIEVGLRDDFYSSTMADGWWPPLQAGARHEQALGCPLFDPPSVTYAHMGSPLHILLELPWAAWAAGGAGFVTAVTMVFALPYKAASQWHKSRSEYWQARLEADKAKRDWLDSARVRNEGVALLGLSSPTPDREPVGSERHATPG